MADLDLETLEELMKVTYLQLIPHSKINLNRDLMIETEISLVADINPKSQGLDQRRKSLININTVKTGKRRNTKRRKGHTQKTVMRVKNLNQKKRKKRKKRKK